MAKVALILNLERIGPTYTVGEVHFALTVSTSYDTDIPTVDFGSHLKSLLPWKMDEVGEVMVAVEKDGKIAMQELPAAAPDATADVVELQESIEAKLHCWYDQGHVSRFVWDPKPDGHETDDGNNLRTMLAAVATVNGSVASATRLTIWFTLPKDVVDGATFIHAAPVFGTGEGRRRPGDAIMTFGADEAPGSKWPYVPLEEQDDLTAYYHPWKRPEPLSAPLIDVDSYWISSGANIGQVGGDLAGDWILEARAPIEDAFDLASRLLEGLRHIIKEGATIDPLTDIAYLRAGVLATARDLAGSGVGADGPLELLMDAAIVPDELREGFVAALEQYEKNMSMAEWASVTLTAVPGLPGTDWVARAVADQAYSFLPEGVGVSRVELPSELDRLESLQSALSADANLVSIVLTQWGRAVQSYGDPALTSYWREVAPNLPSRLEGTPIRRFLARQNLHPVWEDLNNLDHEAANEKDQLIERIRNCLWAAVEKRAWTTPTGPYADRKPPIGREPGEQLYLAIRDQAEHLATKRLAAAILPDELHNMPVERPHPLTLQIDRYSSDPGNAEDLTRRFAGAAVLVREMTRDGIPGPWACLNVADLFPKLSNHEVARIAVVPMRITYRDGVRQVLVDYDGNPLVAPSPLNLGAVGPMLVAKTLNKASDLLRFEVAWKAPAEPGGDPEPEEWTKLPMPKYGREYQAKGFVISNAGALPAELAFSAARPYALKLDPGEVVFESDLLEYLYLRRVPVGAPRLRYYGQLASGFPPAKEARPFPAIPADVFPLARELKPHTSTQHMVHNSAGRIDPVASENSPLILLRERERVVFRAGSPATDVVNWERWIGTELNARESRIAVWKDLLAKLPSKEKRVPETPKKDLDIDDPAVSGLHFRLRLLYPQSSDSPEIYVPLERPTTIESLADVQRVHVPIEIVHIGTTVKLEYTSEGQRHVTLTIPSFYVVALDISSAVPKEEYDYRFATGVKPLGSVKVVLGDEVDTSFMLMAKQTLLFEGVAQSLPTDEQLRAAFLTWFDPKTQHLTFALASTSTELDFVHRVELRYQVWHWNGRHVPNLSWEEVGEQYECFNAHHAFVIKGRTPWDVFGFGHRTENDYMGKVSVRRYGDQLAEIHREELDRDVRCLYYRAIIRVTGRYAGYLGEFQSKATASPFWHHHLVPCRFRGTTPEPKVKFLLPLTDGGPDGTPGMLVILGEPWYQVGGIGEALEVGISWPAVGFREGDFATEAAVETLRDPPCPMAAALREALSPSTLEGLGNAGDPAPRIRTAIVAELDTFALHHVPDPALLEDIEHGSMKLPGPLREWYVGGAESEPRVARMIQLFALALRKPEPFEYAEQVQIPLAGPDPIRSKEGYPSKEMIMIAESPAGHTFDTGTEFPLILNSSFIVPRPRMGPDRGSMEVENWTKMKVRTRRRLRVLTPEGTAADSISAWSPGRWVQVLPGRNQYGEHHWGDLGQRRLVTRTMNGIRIPKMNGEPLQGTIRAGFNLDLRLVLLTELVSDARGERGLDRYVGLLMPVGSDVWEPMNAKVEIAKDAPVRIRLLEMQAALERIVDPGGPYRKDHSIRKTAPYPDGALVGRVLCWPYLLMNPSDTPAVLRLLVGNSPHTWESSPPALTLGFESSPAKLTVGNIEVSGWSPEVPIAVRLTPPEDVNNGHGVEIRLGDGPWLKEILPDVIGLPLQGELCLGLELVADAEAELTALLPHRDAEPWEHLFPINDRMLEDLSDEERAIEERTMPDSIARIVRMSDKIDLVAPKL